MSSSTYWSSTLVNSFVYSFRILFSFLSAGAVPWIHVASPPVTVPYPGVLLSVIHTAEVKLLTAEESHVGGLATSILVLATPRRVLLVVATDRETSAVRPSLSPVPRLASPCSTTIALDAMPSGAMHRECLFPRVETQGSPPPSGGRLLVMETTSEGIGGVIPNTLGVHEGAVP